MQTSPVAELQSFVLHLFFSCAAELWSNDVAQEVESNSKLVLLKA
ncbi:MAG: hypothetical protein WCL16_01645 [bacterium]